MIKAENRKNILVDFDVTIEAVYVKDGQKVKSGDNLVKLNLNSVKKEIQDLEQELAIARLEVQKAESKINAEQNDIDSLKEELLTKQRLLNENKDTDIQKLLNDEKNVEREYERFLEELNIKKTLFD